MGRELLGLQPEALPEPRGGLGELPLHVEHGPQGILKLRVVRLLLDERLEQGLGRLVLTLPTFATARVYWYAGSRRAQAGRAEASAASASSRRSILRHTRPNPRRISGSSAASFLARTQYERDRSSSPCRSATAAACRSAVTEAGRRARARS